MAGAARQAGPWVCLSLFPPRLASCFLLFESLHLLFPPGMLSKIFPSLKILLICCYETLISSLLEALLEPPSRDWSPHFLS